LSGNDAPSDGYQYFDDITVTDLSSGSASSELDLGNTNAQDINIGNMNETEATTIEGGSGININAGVANLDVTGGAISLNGSGASSFVTDNGSLTLGAGGGTGGGVVVQTQAPTTTAFQVQGTDVNLFTVDSTDNEISLGAGAGNSIGYNKIGQHIDGGTGVNTITATKLTTTAGGTIASVSGYFNDSVYQSTPNNQFGFAIYADNGGQPGAYIASSATGNLGSVGVWQTLPITATLTASTTYWLVYWQNGDQVDSSNGINYDLGLSGAQTVYNTYTWQSGADNGWPDTFPTVGLGTVTGMKMSLYATFASSAPALTVNQYGTLAQTGAALFQDPTDSTQAMQVEDSLGDVLLSADTADMDVSVGGALIVSGNITVDGHIVTGGSTPQIAAGAAACTSPTVNLSGDDTSGTITVTAGTGCSGGGALATVTFSSAFTAVPHITLTPGSAAAAALDAYINDSTVSTTGFSVGVGSAPANSVMYQWNYIAVQ